MKLPQPFLKISDIEADALSRTPQFLTSILSEAANSFAKGEQDILVKALNDHLGREFQKSDLEDCEMVITPDTPKGSYYFCHKGKVLGFLEKGDIYSTYANGEDFLANKITLYMDIKFTPHENRNTGNDIQPS